MTQISVTQRIGDIATKLPKATQVFREFEIDFCCGGHRPLQEAIIEQKLDEQRVLACLSKVAEEAETLTEQTNFAAMSSTDLIDYIEGTHHVFMKQMMPELSGLTTKILQVHGPNNPDLFKVHTVFHNLKTEIEQHLIKEEEILFPLLKEYETIASKEKREQILAVMAETENEHEVAGGALKELRIITNQYAVPEDGCGTYTQTYHNLEEVESDLFLHIHLENNILFPRLHRAS